MMTMTLEMESLKTRLRTTWMSGDYGYFAKYLLPGAMDFLNRLDIAPGTQRRTRPSEKRLRSNCSAATAPRQPPRSARSTTTS